MTLGVGKSKKIAKRNGAQAMIEVLKQGPVQPQIEPGNIKQEHDPDDMAIVST